MNKHSVSENEPSPLPSAFLPSALHRRPPCNDFDFPAGLHPLLQQVYRRRRLVSVDELQLSLDNLLSPDSMKGIGDAVARLHEALKAEQQIRIVADFDADGASSCALAILALQAFGHDKVDYIVPNRFEYGYGLSEKIVATLVLQNPADKAPPDLLITVDNGIASTDGVAAAKAAGVDTIVTDHHLAAEQLPEAAAIVNPNQPGCSFASKCLAGVGVIFYVMSALRSHLRQKGWFESRGLALPNLAQLLDLVALGTVADVVPLDWNNRILVSEGLKRIRAGRCRPGISALLQAASRGQASADAADLAFSVGPRLNAAGRLEDMRVGIECLLSQSPDEAWPLAGELDALNRKRRNIESKMGREALRIVANINIDQGEGDLPAAICLFKENWHEGVLGIVAARVKERYHRPVVAFAKAGDELKGSARSVPGFHIRDALDAVASRHPGLISKFGGHAMAAGLSLKADDFAKFQTAFTAEAEHLLDESSMQAKIESDGPLPPDCMTLSAAEALAEAGPWGQGFPPPVFDGCFQILQQQKLKERHLKLRLRAHPASPDAPAQADSPAIEAIAFNLNHDDWPPTHASEIHIVYRLEVNEFRNRRRPQLIIQHILGYC